MRIAIGSDHAGFHLKRALIEHLEKSGHDVIDCGATSDERVDYPEFGAAVGRTVISGEAERGVAICGSGIGICMAANKVPHVRAGVAYDSETAKLMREHNDAQVICFGERLTDAKTAIAALDVFLATEFAGGRHQGRVEQLSNLDDAR
jgi:ribose 5-phosphate isomerase B